MAVGSVLVVKTDVSGGMPHGDTKCEASEEGQELIVPMNNTVSGRGSRVDWAAAAPAAPVAAERWEALHLLRAIPCPP